MDLLVNVRREQLIVRFQMPRMQCQHWMAMRNRALVNDDAVRERIFVQIVRREQPRELLFGVDLTFRIVRELNGY